MKKIPRDLSGNDLVKYLKKLGYHSTRQVGSHIRLTTEERGLAGTPPRNILFQLRDMRSTINKKRVP